MGCDIHMVLERKMGDYWVGIHAYPYLHEDAVPVHTGDYKKIEGLQFSGWRARQRNYNMFAALASVRGESPFGYEPKGLPEDVSHLAQGLSDEYGEDGHSHSWALLPEFLKCYGYGKYGEDSPEHTDAAVGAIEGKVPFAHLTNEVTGLKYLNEYGDDDAVMNDYRIVYWFDN